MFAAMASAAPPALREEVTRSAVETPQDVLVGAMEAMFLDPAIWNDDKIRVPVLALYTKSPVWSPAYMQYVEGIVPDLDYQIVPDTDHFLMLEKGEEVNQRIDRWLVKKNLLGK